MQPKIINNKKRLWTPTKTTKHTQNNNNTLTQPKGVSKTTRKIRFYGNHTHAKHACVCLVDENRGVQ